MCQCLKEYLGMLKDIPNTFVFGNNVNMYLLRGRNVHFRTNVTNISYCLFDGINFRFIFLEIPFLLVNIMPRANIRKVQSIIWSNKVWKTISGCMPCMPKILSAAFANKNESPGLSGVFC